MSDNPYQVARPSEGEGKTKIVVTYWAELWRPMEKNSHGESLVSPKFDTQGAAAEWIRKRREEFDQVALWKRTSREGRDYEDEPMSTLDAPLPSPEKLHDLVEELKTMIKAKKVELDRAGPRGKPLARPAKTMDPLEVRMLTYDEVYDENGLPRFDIDADGYPVS